MFNAVSYGAEVQTITASIVLGYGPGQVDPPRLLIVNAASLTITLPPITTIPATQPTLSQAAVGVGSGFIITILVLSSSQAPTINAASGDTLNATPSLATAQLTLTLIASPSDRTWYKLSA